MHELTLYLGYIVDLGLAQKVRYQVLPARRRLGAYAVKIFMPGGDDRLSHGLATVATHGTFFAIDANPGVEPGWNRQTAMKTGAIEAQCRSQAGFIGYFIIHGFC